ncbi:MAG TPA: hypothetical protein VGU61_20240 [Noviherbaspirillum sp.]|jgi:hypothetical protein|uniref:hypothetical protein n=1 Tax=Noviherbaspirillum sp. TaxID=1926288 RepID=UPI002DDD0B6F|nr:hypothetical protein [Noviherbaspirillum sp.]HEV2612604.1 hypothetical protein [Noviherbaspirillum sp.]
MIFVSFGSLLCLILLHIFADKFKFLEGIPRSRWLSIAGGVSIAYVFLHLLPEVTAADRTIKEASGSLLQWIDHHGFLVALVGVTVFYGLERAVRRSKYGDDWEGSEKKASRKVFWLHLASFSFYNVVVGYLMIHHNTMGPLSFGFFTVAMALHFVVVDFGMRDDFKEDYGRIGRWVISLSLALGWLLGYSHALSEHIVSIFIAFLGGGIVLNAIKEELPDERQSDFLAFVGGVGGYAALLLAL